MKKIVIIPARGGSKRIPRKNVKKFYGKPIIAYSLESAQQASVFDFIHVSTEDKEIYDTVSQLGFCPEFYRTDGNASDQAPVRDVLVEVINKFEDHGHVFDIICLLSATAPLISSDDLKDALHIFEKSKMLHPMLAVTKYPVPIEWAMKLESSEKTIVPVNSDLFFKSSHGFKDTYYDVGSFAFFTREHLLSPSKDIKFMPYVLPQLKSVDVDNMEDWNTLEKLYAINKKQMKLKY
jgi:pseudaminic acid cytidylyltransferase